MKGFLWCLPFHFVAPVVAPTLVFCNSVCTTVHTIIYRRKIEECIRRMYRRKRENGDKKSVSAGRKTAQCIRKRKNRKNTREKRMYIFCKGFKTKKGLPTHLRSNPFSSCSYSLISSVGSSSSSMARISVWLQKNFSSLIFLPKVFSQAALMSANIRDSTTALMAAKSMRICS